MYEQEADRIADEVMTAAAHPVCRDAPPQIQRLSGQSTGLMDAPPASVDHVLASPGRQLESAIRQEMEQRFGYDFSGVRVHLGGAAEQSAREVNANAYTVGQHVVFASGKYAPYTQDGKRLLAHELAHTVQQRNAVVGMLARQPRTVAEIDPEIAAVNALRRETRDNALAILRTAGRDVSGRVRRRPGSSRRGTPGRHLGEILSTELEDVMGDESLSAGLRRSAQEVLAELEQQESVLEKLGKERGEAARQTFAGPKQTVKSPEKAKASSPTKDSPKVKTEPVKPSGAVRTTEDVNAKSVGSAAKVETKGVEAVAKAESAALKEAKAATKLARVGSGITKVGSLAFHALLPGPLDVLMLMVDYFGSFAAAHEAIRSRNMQTGFSLGLAGFIMGRSHRAIVNRFRRRFIVRDVTTQVLGAEGIAEKAHNTGLEAGFQYAGLLSDDAKDALREAGFSALAAVGRLPEQNELFSPDGVARMAGALLPSVDRIFEQMREEAER